MPSGTRSFSDISVLEYWRRFESDSKDICSRLARMGDDVIVLASEGNRACVTYSQRQCKVRRNGSGPAGTLRG